MRSTLYVALVIVACSGEPPAQATSEGTMKNLTPVSVESTVSVPEDGVDQRSAASIEPAFQALANRTKFAIDAVADVWDQRGQADGFASLGADTKIPHAQLPMKWGYVTCGTTNTVHSASEAVTPSASTGNFRITFATAMPNANYAVLVTPGTASFLVPVLSSRTTTYFEVYFKEWNSGAGSIATAFQTPNSGSVAVDFSFAVLAGT